MADERKARMEPITITETETEFGSRFFNIGQGTKCADRLNWDEMLGQLVTLTHYDVRRPLYPMDRLTKDRRRELGFDAVKQETPDPDFAEVGQIDLRAIIEAQKVALDAAKEALERWRYVQIGQSIAPGYFQEIKAQTESAIEKIEAADSTGKVAANG